MSVGSTIIQGVFSGILVLAPATVLKSDRLKVTVVLTFIALFGACKLGGLILAAPATLLLVLYFLWVQYVGRASGGAKRVLFFMTLVLSALYLVVQILHLPVRFALEQPLVLIMANVAGIFMALCMFAGPMELLIRRSRSLNDEMILEENPFLPDDVVGNPPVSEQNSGGHLVESPRETCPYCESIVVPDSDGRCPSCHRPII